MENEPDLRLRSRRNIFKTNQKHCWTTVVYYPASIWAASANPFIQIAWLCLTDQGQVSGNWHMQTAVWAPRLKSDLPSYSHLLPVRLYSRDTVPPFGYACPLSSSTHTSLQSPAHDCAHSLTLDTRNMCIEYPTGDPAVIKTVSKRGKNLKRQT